MDNVDVLSENRNISSGTDHCINANDAKTFSVTEDDISNKDSANYNDLKNKNTLNGNSNDVQTSPSLVNGMGKGAEKDALGSSKLVHNINNLNDKVNVNINEKKLGEESKSDKIMGSQELEAEEDNKSVASVEGKSSEGKVKENDKAKGESIDSKDVINTGSPIQTKTPEKLKSTELETKDSPKKMENISPKSEKSLKSVDTTDKSKENLNTSEPINKPDNINSETSKHSSQLEDTNTLGTPKKLQEALPETPKSASKLENKISTPEPIIKQEENKPESVGTPEVIKPLSSKHLDNPVTPEPASKPASPKHADKPEEIKPVTPESASKPVSPKVVIKPEEIKTVTPESASKPVSPKIVTKPEEIKTVTPESASKPVSPKVVTKPEEIKTVTLESASKPVTPKDVGKPEVKPITAEPDEVTTKVSKSTNIPLSAEKPEKITPTTEETEKKTEYLSGKTEETKCNKEAKIEKVPVEEEIITAKNIRGTGWDEKVVETWRKSEDDKEEKSSIENEIIVKKDDKIGEDGMADMMTNVEDCITEVKVKDKPDTKGENLMVDKKIEKVETPKLDTEQSPEESKKKIKKTIKKDNETKENKIAKTKISKMETETSDEKKQTAKLKKEKELKEHHKQIVRAVRKLLPEEGHDSGVDETTQSKDGAGKTPPKDGRISPKKRQPRSMDPSPMKRTPQSTASVERKLPMNKVEVGKSASPNIKNVRSKIGSLDNATYKPGGGKIKIESKKLDFSKASSRIAAKNDAYIPGGGDKKIEIQKLKWNANSKIGSLDNKAHKPGGGDKKVETQKLSFKEKAQSKVGSKDNIKHKAGGGEVEIPIEKLEFKANAASKIGSLDNVKHKPKGGDKKIFDDKDYLRQMQISSNASPCKTPTSKTSSGRESGAISPATTGTNSPGPQEE